MNKPFKSIEKQIDILKERGLIFLDENSAKKKLLEFGYYEIVNGYKSPLLVQNEQKRHDKYKNNETFEHLYSLYQMDKSLRMSILKSLLDVELTLRTAIAYTIAKEFGEKEENYLKRENYNSGKKRIGKNGEYFFSIDNTIAKFNKILKSNDQPFKHYREKYKNIPPWILLKGTTLGNLIHFLKIQKSHIKNQIFSIISGLPEEMFSTTISLKELYSDLFTLFNVFRNRCAHSGRIYNYNPTATIIRRNEFFIKVLEMNEKNENQIPNNIHTLYAAFGLLSCKDPLQELEQELEQNIFEHFKKYPHDKNIILTSMGFHRNLKKITPGT